jgi:anti-sigma regulatory factor (Ser/Thr protein kinase)
MSQATALRERGTNQAAEVESSTELEPEPGASRHGRRFLRDLLSNRATAEQLEAAEVVVSELVTNAVRHAWTPDRIRLEIGFRLDRSVYVAVTDSSWRLPVLRWVDPQQEAGGWGLHLVTQLSQRWGTDTLSAGKRVWSVVAAW